MSKHNRYLIVVERERVTMMTFATDIAGKSKLFSSKWVKATMRSDYNAGGSFSHSACGFFSNCLGQNWLLRFGDSRAQWGDWPFSNSPLIRFGWPDAHLATTFASIMILQNNLNSLFFSVSFSECFSLNLIDVRMRSYSKVWKRIEESTDGYESSDRIWTWTGWINRPSDLVCPHSMATN